MPTNRDQRPLHGIGAWARRWPALLLIVAGAGFALVLPARCAQLSPRCSSVSTPSDYVTAAVIGGIAGLLAALFVIWGTLQNARRRSSLALRFPDSLILDVKVDSFTVRAMQALRVDVTRVGMMVVVVSVRGIQFWSGNHANRLLLDVEWGEALHASLGDEHGDIHAGSRSLLAGLAYQRLAFEVVRDQSSTVVQFPVYSPDFGTTTALYRDTFDLRQLTREINGYKAVHDRERAAS